MSSSVDHSRRRGSSLLEEGKCGRPHRRQHVVNVRVGADRAQQHPERGPAEKGHRAHRRHNALEAKAGEDRVTQLPGSLGAKVGLLLEISVQAAGLREALGDGRIDEEDVVARDADRQHVLDGSQ
eukprot:3521477-Pleurochrysis_carterae.AAC.1